MLVAPTDSQHMLYQSYGVLKPVRGPVPVELRPRSAQEYMDFDVWNRFDELSQFRHMNPHSLQRRKGEEIINVAFDLLDALTILPRRQVSIDAAWAAIYQLINTSPLFFFHQKSDPKTAEVVMGIKGLKTYAVAGQRKRKLNTLLQALRRVYEETEKRRPPPAQKRNVKYEIKLWAALLGFLLVLDWAPKGMVVVQCVKESTRALMIQGLYMVECGPGEGTRYTEEDDHGGTRSYRGTTTNGLSSDEPDWDGKDVVMVEAGVVPLKSALRDEKESRPRRSVSFSPQPHSVRYGVYGH